MSPYHVNGHALNNTVFLNIENKNYGSEDWLNRIPVTKDIKKRPR